MGHSVKLWSVKPDALLLNDMLNGYLLAKTLNPKLQ